MNSLKRIKKLISIKENLLLDKKYKKLIKKGIKINSIFKFLLKVLDASNLVIIKWDVQEKIAQIEKIFVNTKIFWLYSLPNQKLKKKSYKGNITKIKIGMILKNIFRTKLKLILLFFFCDKFGNK